MDKKTFFGALFDFSFTEFVTTRLIKLIFGLSILLAGFSALALVITSFAAGTLAVLGALVVAPIVFLLYVIVARVWLEVVIALFKVAEHTSRIPEVARAPSASPMSAHPSA
ncbi:MAG: DUF4282 domain-containing protein [Planctomycetota bacterium]